MKIEVCGCSYRYPYSIKGHEYAIQDINLVVWPAQALGIIGANGAGKSTLACLLAGLLKPSQGTVLVDGTSLYTSSASKAAIAPKVAKASKAGRSSRAFKVSKKDALADFRRSVAMVSQFPEDQFFTESVYEELSFGLKKQCLDNEMIRLRVMSVLHELGLELDEESLEHRSPFGFGSGEKRLIGIAAALVMRPEVLILDEPTAGLDAISSRLVWGIIQRLRQGLSIILISHELESVVRLVDHLVVLHEGRIIHQGSPDEAFSNYEDLFRLGLELPQITILGHELEKAGIISLGVRPIFEVQEAAELIREWLKN